MYKYRPLEQFTPFFQWFVDNNIPFDVISSILILLFNIFFVYFGIWKVLSSPKLIPSSWELMVGGLYRFILLLLHRHVSSIHSHRYFPLTFTLFLFIFLCNAGGLIPYSFTFTSHISVTFSLSFILFVGIIILAFYYNRLDYFSFFKPKGIKNVYLRSFLICIEIVSFLIRPFSLSIRLFANMLAGHTLLYIITNFLTFLISQKWALVWIIPFIVLFLIFMLEACIVFIQTYVFVVLTVIYLNDIYNIIH